MKKYLTQFLFLSFVILAVSCNEAVKPNPVFEQALPDSKPYKDELAKQLKLYLHVISLTRKKLRKPKRQILIQKLPNGLPKETMLM